MQYRSAIYYYIKKIKYDANNLVVLCKEHHTDVHQNRLKIFGYTKTVNGSRKLKYEFVQEKRKVLKYQSMVKYITTTYKKDYTEKRIKLGAIKNKIFSDKKVNIGEQTLRKILSDKYLS